MLGRLGRRGAYLTPLAALGAAAAVPSTANFTFSQVGSGWGFGYNDTTDATRRYLAPNKSSGTSATSNSFGAWKVTGSDATTTLVRPTSGSFDKALEARVDGGAWTFVSGPTTGTSATVTLFTGLADTTHTLELRLWASEPTNTFAWTKTGNIFSVTGVAPSVAPYTGWRLPGGTEGDQLSGNALGAAAANYYPPNVVLHPTVTGITANNPSIRVRGDYTELVIAATGQYVHYSIDNGTPVRVDRGSTATSNFGATILSGLSGTHDYNVWAGDTSTQWLSVGGLFASIGVQALTSRGLLDQYGDSITFGAGTQSSGDTDTFIIASSRGRCGTNFGHSGWTIADLKAAIDALLTAKPAVTSSDVAVIAVGFNDANIALTTQKQTDYTYIVNALVTKGYGLIICRGVYITVSGGTFTAFNNSLSSLITGIGNPIVKFLDPAPYVTAPVATADNTHPTAAGYVTLAADFLPAYVALGA